MGNVAATNPSKSIPIGDLTLASRSAIRDNVDQQLTDIAIAAAFVTSESNAVIRDMLPSTDMGIAVPTATSETWLVPGPGVGGTELTYFTRQLTTQQAAAFYGTDTEMATPNISRIRIALGPNATTIRGVFQPEPEYARLEPVSYFSVAIMFRPQQTVTVLVMPRVAFPANSERLVMLGRMIDQIGQTVSGPTI